MSSPQATTALAIHALQEDVVACRRCGESGFLAAPNPLRPSDLRRHRVLLVGQAPGPVTDRKGFHFAGPAGSFLDRWCQQAGFRPGEWRDVMYLTSLTRCFPGKATSGKGDRPPSRAEVQLCRPFLDRELALVDPPLMILVGKMAIDAFLGPKPLTETVGQVFERDGRLWLPLPHASGVSRWLNDPRHRALLNRALEHLARLRTTLSLSAD